MQEAYIHLPKADNLGNDLTAEAVKVGLALLDRFGGWTAMEAHGGWKDPATGQVYVEKVDRYAVAADWSDPTAGRDLLRIAAEAARDMRQVCVYVAFPGGVVFQPPKPDLEVAA